MSDRIPCGTARRRQLVRTTLDAGVPRVNGIDYVEVSADQTVLTVGFIHPLDAVPGAAALGRFNFRLEGGVRIKPVTITGATPDVAKGLVALTVDQPGDFSLYRLRLVAGLATEEVPAGFDPALAAVDVDFKAACPSPFDCRAEDPGAAAPPRPPLIDYLAKDYASFRTLMLARISVTTPDWTERNPADLGIMLVEALAQTADDLSYFQDAAATEAYLGTARLRSSVRRHARLLDYPLGEGVSARAWLSLDPAVVDGIGPAPDDSAVPVGQRVETRPAPDGSVVPFETLHPIRVRAARAAIPFYDWSGENCCLAKGATGATLRDTDAKLVPGDAILLCQSTNPETGEAQLVDARLRHVVRLTEVTPRVDPLTGDKVVSIRWAAADALPFELRLIGPVGELACARANIVLAEQRASRTLPAGSGGLKRDVLRNRVRLPGVRLAFAEPYDDAAARGAPATTAVPAPSRAVAQITLDDAAGHWTPQPDLLGASATALAFAVEPDDRGEAVLRFGEGKLGRRLPDKPAFAIRYAAGLGAAGNVGADTLTVARGLPGIAATNPLPAFGGVDPEPLAVARLTAPQAFKVNRRCVTPEDYAAMTGRFPGVQRATARRRWTGSWYSIFLYVDLLSGLDPDEAFAEALLAFLEPARMAGDDLAVRPPRRVALDIALRVCVAAGYRASEVEAALRRVLGRTGLFDPDRFSFGDPVWLSPLIAAAQSVPGVDHVTATRFQRWGRPAAGELQQAVLRVDESEIIVADSDANFPERGQVAFEMIGGL